MMGGRPTSATCVVIQLNGLWRRRRRRCVSVMIDFPCCIFSFSDPPGPHRSLALIIAHAGTTFWIIFQKQTLTAVQSYFSLSLRPDRSILDLWFASEFSPWCAWRGVKNLIPSFLCEISYEYVNAHQDYDVSQFKFKYFNCRVWSSILTQSPDFWKEWSNDYSSSSIMVLPVELT